MSPAPTTQDIHGLHVLAILTAAKELSAAIVRAGGSERALLSGAQFREEVDQLATAVDRFSNWERKAIARGVLPPQPTTRAVVDALRRAAAYLAADPEQLAAMTMSAEAVDDAFNVAPEPASHGAVVTESFDGSFNFDSLFAEEGE